MCATMQYEKFSTEEMHWSNESQQPNDDVGMCVDGVAGWGVAL
jgi:hypothetical protein